MLSYTRYFKKTCMLFNYFIDYFLNQHYRNLKIANVKR